MTSHLNLLHNVMDARAGSLTKCRLPRRVCHRLAVIDALSATRISARSAIYLCTTLYILVLGAGSSLYRCYLIAYLATSGWVVVR